MIVVIMVYYTYLDRLYFSLFDYMCFILIYWKLKNLSFKNILFLEYRYLSDYLSYGHDSFCVYS